MGNTEADGANGILRNTRIAVPLKCLSKFWRLLEISLINYKVALSLSGRNTVFCLQMVMIMMMVILIILFFTIKDTKLYVPVVTFSAKNNQKLSKLLNQVFHRPVYRNEYKTES